VDENGGSMEWECKESPMQPNTLIFLMQTVAETEKLHGKTKDREEKST